MKTALLGLSLAGLGLLAPVATAQDYAGISIITPNSRHQTLSSGPHVVRPLSKSKDGSKNSGTIHPKDQPFSLVPSPTATPGKIHPLSPVTPIPAPNKIEILDKNGKPVTVWPAGQTLHYPTLYKDSSN